jgi:hypothetical protein
MIRYTGYIYLSDTVGAICFFCRVHLMMEKTYMVDYLLFMVFVLYCIVGLFVFSLSCLPMVMK